jgi:tryptophan-rich sensory protein
MSVRFSIVEMALWLTPSICAMLVWVRLRAERSCSSGSSASSYLLQVLISGRSFVLIFLVSERTSNRRTDEQFERDALEPLGPWPR